MLLLEYLFSSPLGMVANWDCGENRLELVVAEVGVVMRLEKTAVMAKNIKERMNLWRVRNKPKLATGGGVLIWLTMIKCIIA